MLVKQLFSSWRREWGPASSSMLLGAPWSPTIVQKHNTHTDRHTDTHSLFAYCHRLLPVRCGALESNSQVVESKSYAINLISDSVELYFHLIQTTACMAKGNYISTASICPEVVDSQSKPPQVFLPRYPLCEINRTVPGFIYDLSQ